MTYEATPAMVAPIVGVVLSVARSLVPIREVVSIRQSRRLGVRACRVAGLLECLWHAWLLNIIDSRMSLVESSLVFRMV